MNAAGASVSGNEATPAGGQAPWIEGVLRFWFGELREDDWFKSSAELDARIRLQYEALYQRLVATDADGIVAPRAVLAAVVVLDQFARNMYRGTARAYAADPLARRLARGAVDRGSDAAMAPAERYFIYLPFEHSEDRDDQALAVRLIGRLGNASWTRYALAHQALINRFGRFPHRNAALGRASTPEESAILDEPMGSF
jgi:uncharacterized protein (DUF924 family)